MKVPHIPLRRRGTVVAAVGVCTLALGGWALAEGDVPLLSSDSAPSTTTTTTLPTSAGAGTDNVAAATNTKDGRTVIALSIKVVQIDSEVVDPVNAAVAVASCNDCQTVAIALEGVLVVGSPTTFDPTNIALAINTECSNCQTLAAAYQTVVQNGTRVRISGEGRQEIAAIRKELELLRTSDLDILTIWQRVDDAAARFTTVLQTQVFPIGPPPTTPMASTGTTTTEAGAATAASSSTTSSTAPSSTTTTSTPPTTAALP